ncbi:MAG TPA: PAS domain S-box protein [Gemmatimonadaceae bacterium]|jgi:PAS domain S-box-containing protein
MSARPPSTDSSPTSIAALLRERDQLFLLHEALAEVERARTLGERLGILVQAIGRVGYGRVDTVADYVMPPEAQLVSEVGSSAFLNSNELIVPVRSVDGATVATLVLGEPDQPGPPTLARVRTVELFAQQVASIIENARLYEESQRERGRGEALADIARAVSGSLRLADVLQLSLRHAVALLRTEGAALGLVRDDKLAMVAAVGEAQGLIGAAVPLEGSLVGRAVLERRTSICNECDIEDAYGPTRVAVGVHNTLHAPLFSSDGVIGALTVINRDAAFTEDDAVVLQRLADQVAVAVANARLYEEAKAAADRYQQASEDERRARDAVAQSESRYRNLFETATDAIYALDAMGAFTSVNEATCILSGRTRDELLGRNALGFVPSNESAMVKEHFKSALSGAPRRYECTFVRADGTRRLASVTNTPIRHTARVIGVLAVARDVTDERTRALALERSEARYTRLVETASDAIFTVDRDGRLTAVNRSLERATGADRDTLLGTPFDELIDQRDRGLVDDALGAAFADQRRRVELRYSDAEGELRQCSLTLTPLSEDGEVTGALGVVRDVTDEKRLAEQLLQQEKLAAVGQLVSGVAHELNNPLASVMAFAQLLLAAPEDAAHDRRAIDAINHEAKRAAKIVSNLLTFARQHQPERTIADLNRVVDDTLELRRYALRLAQVEIETRLDPELPITWADPFQLQQVVLNLVTNAEHALSNWDGDRRIVVTTARAGKELVVRVSDSGPGIAPEHLPRIFNPFFTTKPVGEGTGLGLSISDGILREHGGRIRVESQLGFGATFILELPVVAPPLTEPEPEPEPAPPSAQARRLLLVDDEPTIRQAITKYFGSLGHTVDAVGSGREAIARATETRYDAVMLDLRLPDRSGDEIFAEMRELPTAPRRVVFITGDTQSDAAQRALAATGCVTVSKPFLLDELASIVLAEADG